MSDVDSEVIRAYGILNDQVKPGDLILYGIPYPGTYVTDAEGVVVAKSFHGSYKIRDSPEALLDAALGGAQLDGSAVLPSRGDGEVRVQVALRGGAARLAKRIAELGRTRAARRAERARPQPPWSTCPGSAPVCLFCSRTTWPFTIVAT